MCSGRELIVFQIMLKLRGIFGDNTDAVISGLGIDMSDIDSFVRNNREFHTLNRFYLNQRR